MKKTIIVLLSVLTCAIVSICILLYNHNPNRELVSLIKKWVDKEIILPDPMHLEYVLGTDTTLLVNPSSYVIIHYIDSANCTSCNLKLDLWKSFIDNINTISQRKVSLVFVSSLDKDYLKRLFLYDDRFLVIHIDRDLFTPLNELSNNKYFNTLLMDEHKFVVTVGNPLLTTDLKNNYYKFIMQ